MSLKGVVHLFFVNYNIFKFQSGCLMHNQVITAYSLFISFNNEKFLLSPLLFENHLWKIMWLACFGANWI